MKMRDSFLLTVPVTTRGFTKLHKHIKDWKRWLWFHCTASLLPLATQNKLCKGTTLIKHFLQMTCSSINLKEHFHNCKREIASRLV